jgi:transposase
VLAARLAHWLGYWTSPDTLFRRQRQKAFVLPAPRVLGVDGLALRRGSIFGTLQVNLERRQSAAVLKGRTAEPLTTWLQAQPQATFLVRDLSDAYLLAGHLAVPDALQLADRCLLVHNVSDAL